MSFFPKPTKLNDCSDREGDNELFIVEGDSAAKSVARSRDASLQAVLPMQGKPMNAIKASKSAVENNDLFQTLIGALGADWDQRFDIGRLRYRRIILLFDPDADGIHCGALMLMFFQRWMPSLLSANKLFVIHPPLYEITSHDHGDSIHAFSDEHYRKLRKALDDKQIKFTARRFRGLASMNESTLISTCLDPDTRHAHVLTTADAQQATAIFSGDRVFPQGS